MKIFIYILFITISVTGYSQTQVSGTVKDEKNNPVPGASISIMDSYDGSTADSLGRFSFITTEKDKRLLLVTSAGYKKYQDTINLSAVSIHLDIRLAHDMTSLGEVVITAGSFEASDKSRSAQLSSLDIVTTASANADITSALKTLPGTQQVGDQGGLFVRGGTASESKIFIDGTLVNNFFYSSEPFQASRGRFSPFLFKGTIFNTGGYGALYGQALSSVLLLESIDLPERSSAQVGLSNVAVGGGFQKLSKNKRSSWGIEYDYSDLRLAFNMNKQNFDYFRIPVSQSLNLNYRIKTSKNGMLKYFGYVNRSNSGFRYSDLDSIGFDNAFQVKNTNIYQNLSWKERWGKGWEVNLGISYSDNRTHLRTDLQNAQQEDVPVLYDLFFDFKTYQIKTIGNYVNARWTLEKKLNHLATIRVGNEYQYSNEVNHFSTFYNINVQDTLKENLLASYLETDFHLTPNLTLRTGLRNEHSALFNRWNTAPRISLARRMGMQGQLSLAYGIFYQNPENQYLQSTNGLRFERATHYILQYQRIAKSRILSTELFYKKYQDLIKASEGFGKLTAMNNQGFGDAKGVELFWRDKISLRYVDYWISYSYLDTKRDFLQYPHALRPPFSAKHTASVVMKTMVPTIKTQFNFSYTFASGRPYYDLITGINDKTTIRREGKTVNYNDLSFSLSYLPQMVKRNPKFFSVIILSVTNLPGFNNIYSYRFSADGTQKAAVLPSSKRFWYIGYILTFGTDRTQDAIENHL